MKKQENLDEQKAQKRIFTIPNAMSAFRLCLIPVLIWLYCVKKNHLQTMGVLILSGFTDLADGFVARRFHMISDLGKILDPVADKLTQAAMLFCLVTRFPLMLLPLALLIVKELFMGVTGLLVIRKTGGVFGAKWHGKIATCLLDAMMIIHVAWFDIPKSVSELLIFSCVVMMIVSFVFYGIHNVKALKNGKL